MQPEERRLRDILACADELSEYLGGQSEDDFVEDRLLRRAVERLLTIIGEAAKSLTDETRSAIPQPWKEIIRFRDKGIHAYDAILPQRVYRIATESVPDLAEAVRRHLSKT
ncbi:MAG: HepT-like ribonuclease domain-containing protein [Thermoplasmatota archaeon]